MTTPLRAPTHQQRAPRQVACISLVVVAQSRAPLVLHTLVPYTAVTLEPQPQLRTVRQQTNCNLVLPQGQPAQVLRAWAAPFTQTTYTLLAGPLPVSVHSIRYITHR